MNSQNTPVGRKKMRRENIVKWLLEKLLGSLFVSIVIVWGPIIGLTHDKLGFHIVYTIVALSTSLASLIAYLLVPTYFDVLKAK